MRSDHNLSFIKNRIAEIRSALMFNQSTDPDKIPTSIVSVLEIDDAGNMWFLMNKPKRFVDTESEFPAYLQFYRKGKPFYVQVSGDAGVVHDEELIKRFAEGNEAGMEEMMLIRVRMTLIEYHEQKTSVRSESIGTKVYNKLAEIFWDSTPVYEPIRLTPETATI